MEGSMLQGDLVGGSPANQQRLLERLHEYLDANARFDWVKLQDMWSAAPDAVFFNLNGHTYKGREHWTRLWQSVGAWFDAPSIEGAFVVNGGDILRRRTNDRFLATRIARSTAPASIAMRSRSSSIRIRTR